MTRKRKITIVIEVTGDLYAAYDSARFAVDSGALQDAITTHNHLTAGKPYHITNVEIK